MSVGWDVRDSAVLIRGSPSHPWTVVGPPPVSSGREPCARDYSGSLVMSAG